MNPLVALITDFGVTDTYVGVMKGVMLGISPQIRFIDITHAIQPHNVREAAFALLNAYHFFPPGTVFLVIVDPGVGSTRKPIAAQAGDYHFVAPDNGVLSYMLSDHDSYQAVELTAPEYRLPSVSTTFHGRDIFAPAAAHLAAGLSLDQLGPVLDQIFKQPLPKLQVESKRVTGEITHIDRFGNIVTSIGLLRWVGTDRLTLQPRFGDSTSPLPVPATTSTVTVNNQQVQSIYSAYSDVDRGTLLALVGSGGYLEIAVNQGSASTRLSAAIGDRVDLQTG